MNGLTLIVQSILERRTRSALLIITAAIAFLVYGVLGALRFSMFGGSDEYSKNRLIITHEAGMSQALPLAYAERIKTIPGVESVSPATWFGAYYQSTKQMLMAFAVDPKIWLHQHTEMQMSPQDRQRFLTTSNTMLVSAALLHKYQWKVGDTVPLKSVMFFPDSGEEYWPFTIAGTFTNAADAGGRNYIIMHYNYLNESRSLLKNTAGTFVVTVVPGAQIDKVAVAIDEYFGKFEDRTASATDRAFHTAFFKQLGDISLMIKAVLLVAFTSIILVVSSTLTLTVLQRTRDIGILKMMGFSKLQVLMLVAGEAFLLIFMGCFLGTLLSVLANHLVSVQLPDLLPNLSLTSSVIVEIICIAVLVGGLVSSLPALFATHLKAIKALASD